MPRPSKRRKIYDDPPRNEESEPTTTNIYEWQDGVDDREPATISKSIDQSAANNRESSSSATNGNRLSPVTFELLDDDYNSDGDGSNEEEKDEEDETNGKKKKSNNWIDRNDMPTSAPFESEYSVKLEGDRTMTWTIDPPVDSEIGAYKLPIDGPSSIRIAPKFVKHLRNRKDPFQFFKAVVTRDIFEKMLNATNECIRSAMMQEKKSKNSRQEFGQVDVPELTAFFGVMLMLGERGQLEDAMNELFTADIYNCNTLLIRSFNRTRFKALCRHFRFDDQQTDEEDIGAVLVKIAGLFDAVVKNCGSLIVPGRFVRVDEAVVDYDCSKRNPKNLTFSLATSGISKEYEMKIYTLSDARTGVIIDGYIPTEAEDDPDDEDEYIKLKSDVVLKLTRNLNGSGRLVITDRDYTSIKLANQLRSNGLNLVGAMHGGSRGVPKPFKLLNFSKYYGHERTRRSYVKKICAALGREAPASDDHQDDEETEAVDGDRRRAHSAFLYSGSMQLCKFSASQTNERSATYVLSTIHHESKVSKRGFRPKAIQDYKAMKFKVDVAGDLTETFKHAQTPYQWPVRILQWILDIAAATTYNAFVIANAGTPEAKMPRRAFVRHLAWALMEPHCRHQESTGNLSTRQRAILAIVHATQTYHNLYCDRQFSLNESISLKELDRLIRRKANGGQAEAAEAEAFASLADGSTDFRFGNTMALSLISSLRGIPRVLDFRERRGICYAASCRKKNVTTSLRCDMCDRRVCAREHGYVSRDAQGRVDGILCKTMHKETYCMRESPSKEDIDNPRRTRRKDNGAGTSRGATSSASINREPLPLILILDGDSDEDA